MSNTLGWIIVAFVLYLLGMVAVGAAYAKKNSSAEDYFLGGRSLGGFVAALSAQASDMSGWLLMGLPGGVYALGTGQSWIAIGLFLVTVVNWLVISGPLRRYTIRANNSLTLPTYFENRFHDKKKVLLLISSITIVIFFLVYTASALASGGKLFNSVFGVDYRIALCDRLYPGNTDADRPSDRSDHGIWDHWRQPFRSTGCTGRRGRLFRIPEPCQKWR